MKTLVELNGEVEAIKIFLKRLCEALTADPGTQVDYVKLHKEHWWMDEPSDGKAIAYAAPPEGRQLTHEQSAILQLLEKSKAIEKELADIRKMLGAFSVAMQQGKRGGK